MTKPPSLCVCFASFAVTAGCFTLNANAAVIMLGALEASNVILPPPAPVSQTSLKVSTPASSVINQAPAPRTVDSPRSEENASRSARASRSSSNDNESSQNRGSKKRNGGASTSKNQLISRKDRNLEQPAETPASEPEVIKPENPLIGRVDMGFIYSSDYYFRGLDILDRISPDNGGSGVTRWKFAYTQVLRPRVDGLTLEYARVNAYDLQLPRGDAADLPPNERGFNKSSRQFLKDNASFSIPARKQYEEDQLFLKYTRNLPWDVEAALSLGYYRFNDGRWYQDVADRRSGPVDDTLESTLRLTYNGFKDRNNPLAVPWVVPSIAYTADFTGFNGEFAELDLASRSFSLPGKLGTFGFRAGAGYDMGYNAEGDGWSYLAGGVGLSMPVAKSGLTLDIAADYVHALDEDRADSGPYFSVGLRTGYDWFKHGAAAEKAMGKDPFSMAAAPDHAWRVSAGTGWRTWTGNFEHRAAVPYDSLSLIDQRTGSGSLGFAGNGQGAIYKNGSVSGVNGDKDTNPGSSTFTGGSAGGAKTETGDNKHVVFQSDRFEYEQEVDSRRGFNSQSDAELVSPYIHLHRDLTPPSWRGGFHFGVGALYSFSSGELDSGTQLTSLVSGFETIRNYETIYAQDAIHAARFPNGSPQLVTDGNAYGEFYESSSLKGAGPQNTEFAIRNNLSRVASFTSSTVKFQAHELAFPLEFSYDIGTRLHVALSVAPTLAFMDAELDTVTDFRELPDLEAGKKVRNRTDYRLFNFRSIIRFDDEEGGEAANSGFSGTGQVSSSPSASPIGNANTAAQVQQKSSGGKGGRANAPRLPGQSVKVVRDRSHSQEWTWGVTASATGRFDLDEQDRFFVEAWGRYGWLNEISLANSQAAVKVDPSNWSVGVGLGYRF